MAALALTLAWASWDCMATAHARAAGLGSLDRQYAVPGMEDSAALLAGATSAIGQLQRTRLLERAVHTLTPDTLGRIARERVRSDYRWLLLPAALALALFALRQAGTRPAGQARPGRGARRGRARTAVRVTPPRYTGVARSERRHATSRSRRTALSSGA